MLISHESPLCLLEKSKSYNDYQYCLVHLCEKYPEYYNHFKNCLKEGHEVLLDNSIFELGVAFDSDKYAKVIIDLKPTHYIVPDSLEDMEQTISLYKHFVRNYPDLPGNKIGVIQGKTYQELVECYNFMKYNCDYIAISFDYSYYQITGLGNTRLERMCDGRARLIDSFRRERIWDDNKPHHLLGCSLPKEFANYGTLIRSVDTSNPIMCGIKGMRYAKGIGVSQKPVGLLADNMDIKITKDVEDVIFDNIKEFRSMTAAPLWNY